MLWRFQRNDRIVEDSKTRYDNDTSEFGWRSSVTPMAANRQSGFAKPTSMGYGWKCLSGASNRNTGRDTLAIRSSCRTVGRTNPYRDNNSPMVRLRA